MGVDRKPKQKAEGDYAKRTADPGGLATRETTFVFVTPRRWPEKRGEFPFGDFLPIIRFRQRQPDLEHLGLLRRGDDDPEVDLIGHGVGPRRLVRSMGGERRLFHNRGRNAHRRNPAKEQIACDSFHLLARRIGFSGM